ncbi:MAG: alpha/beta hydrolase [Aureispira sp.]|nr:alpha/beta hydrolase [Aureispira sp.]
MRKLQNQAQELLNQGIDGIPLLRLEKEKAFSRFKSPRTIQCKPFDLGHMEAAWFTPQDFKHPNKVILYLHGGGYTTGSFNSHRGLIGKLSTELGAKTLGINYRLAPEHPYPAALDDSIFAYKWLLEHEHYNPKDIIIIGDSAGGGLTLATLLRIREEKLPQPLTAVMMSPWTDLAITGESALINPEKDPLLVSKNAKEWGLWYAGKESILHPFVSPLYGNLSDLAPMLVQVGTEEILLNDSTRLENKIKHAKNTSLTVDVWSGMPHVWQFGWQYIPESKKAIKQIISYVEHQIENAKAPTSIITPDNLASKGLTQKTLDLAQVSFETVKLGAKALKNSWK